MEEPDVQIQTQSTAHWARIGMSLYPEQGRTLLLGRELKTPDEIDAYIDDLIGLLESARKLTKSHLQNLGQEDESAPGGINVMNTGYRSEI